VVLEQDRVMLESMEPDANQREHLYEHDVGLSRLRKLMQSLAQRQLGLDGLALGWGGMISGRVSTQGRRSRS
jgi:hypothetical protein